MVIRVDVVDAALQAVYGPDTEAMLADRRVAVLAASGRQLDDALAGELAGLESLTLLCGRYEGIDERVARAPRERLDLDRPLRPLGRRARRDGRGGRGAAQAAGRARARRERASRSRSRRRSRAVPSIRTTRGRPRTGAGRCPRSCSPATTRRSASGGWRRPRGGGNRTLVR